jgi:hypothetical protein
LILCLLAPAWRRILAAISVQVNTSYGIVRANAGLKSAGDVLEFFFTYQARASPAQHSVFPRLRHNELLSVQLEAVIVGRGKQD